MKIQDIQPGKLYLVKTNITGQVNGIVSARQNDNEFPFEFTAAKFKLKPEEIIKEVV